jgi:VWFA-related protein
MLLKIRFAAAYFVGLLCACGIAAQQPTNAAAVAATPVTVNLDVVAAPKSGPAVGGLQRQDFTVLDNNVPQTIDSFHALGGKDGQVKVIVVMDDVNTDFNRVAFERSEIEKFLRFGNGALAYPTTFALLTDSGLQMQNTFTQDGNALSASLAKDNVPLHTIQRSSGIYGAEERFELSLRALIQLANQEANTPGRKMILWVSPGWALFSGPGVEEQMDDRQRMEIYDNVVGLSTALRLGRITLYAIDPLGTSDSLTRDFYWQTFSKGLKSPNQAEWGDISLQVLAFQSGGQVLNRSNDIAGELQRCVADAQAYYEISFVPSADQARETYHQVEVRVDKPNVSARTVQGYYTQQP